VDEIYIAQEPVLAPKNQINVLEKDQVPSAWKNGKSFYSINLARETDTQFLDELRARQPER
jgi:hypothetical protein